MPETYPKYRIIRDANAESLQTRINEVHALGYKALGITFGPGSGFVALMEFVGLGSQSNFGN